MDSQQQSNIHSLKQRQKKHKQIMNAIYNYKRTPEQIKMLDKVKHATRMQIDLRYKNCSHNQTYKFPYFQNSFDEQFEQEQFPNSNTVLYDLHSQAQVVKKSVSTKTLSLDASRRVKSLQKQHIPQQQQIISRNKRRPLQLGRTPDVNDYLMRKNSLRDRRSRQQSSIKLPQLKKLQSQKKNNLQQIIGKKIFTEASYSPEGKRLAKYLKGTQTNGRQSLNKDQPKKFFLQQV